MTQNINDLVAIVSGVSGLIFGVLGLLSNLLTNRRAAIKEYFEADDLEDLRTARKYIYNHDGDDGDLSANEYFAKVCSHYHFYGLMLKMHYIPKWVFKGSNAEAIVRCYEKSTKYIRVRREKGNIHYACHFEWLYYKVKNYSRQR